jgi:hypothetical protein
MPEDNQPHASGGAAELMRRMARMVGEAQLLPLTVQRYYALDFQSAISPEMSGLGVPDENQALAVQHER